MTLAISTAHNNARLAATVAFADTGSANSRIRLYDVDDTVLVTMTLTKACGTIVDDKLVLQQLDPSGDLIGVSGSAVYGVWISGTGAIVAEGTVSDEAGSGDFKVAGTTGTMLYAGARAILGVTELT